tara:strand:+ start:58 stop:645 length:588 start_codon:yes stop_codon:yes gene_type:complete
MPVVINGSGTITGISAGGLPDGVIQSANLATGVGGKLINYAQTKKTDQFSESVSSGNFSGAAIALTYSCASATNKIIISAQLSTGCDHSASVSATLYIDGSVASAFVRDTEGSPYNNYRVVTVSGGKDSGDSHHGNLVVELLHTPGDTNSHTYDFRLNHNNNDTMELYLNGVEHYSNDTYRHRAMSTMTIKELAA